MVDFNKILFLWLDADDFLPRQVSQYGVSIGLVYKKIPIMLRILRRCQIEAGIPGISFWVSPWKKELCRYETVIIHASKITPPVVRFIKRKDAGVRIIVWYWNPVEKSVPLLSFPDEDCEVWSFDEGDCAKYNLKHNTQYYFKNIQLTEMRSVHDVFFVGADKGRLGQLLGLKQKFEALGLTTCFHITRSGKKKTSNRYEYQQRIHYRQVLDHIAESNAILDIVSEKQSGLTLRPLEALFFQKKLITNDISIIERDFFRPENVFILGARSLDELPLFLRLPYYAVDQAIIDRYDFQNWIRRFFR